MASGPSHCTEKHNFPLYNWRARALFIAKANALCSQGFTLHIIIGIQLMVCWWLLVHSSPLLHTLAIIQHKASDPWKQGNDYYLDWNVLLLILVEHSLCFLTFYEMVKPWLNIACYVGLRHQASWIMQARWHIQHNGQGKANLWH
jgi:hypothetical protein